MPAKMISEIPLPTPRAVTCSPKPHQEDGATSQRNDRCDPEEGTGINYGTTLGAGHTFQTDGNAIGLKCSEDDGAIAGVLVDLLPALLTLFLECLKLRRNSRHELHDDGGGDVGKNIEGKDRHPPQRTTGKHVEHAEYAARVLLEDVLHHDRIDAGDRNKGTETVNDQHAKREPQPLLQLSCLREGAQIDIGS